jgi:hypothetical protein
MTVLDGAMIGRRSFLSRITCGLLAMPLAADAQPSGEVPSVGVVLPGGSYTVAIEGLREGLKPLGLGRLVE